MSRLERLIANAGYSPTKPAPRRFEPAMVFELTRVEQRMTHPGDVEAFGRFSSAVPSSLTSHR